jgi:TrmH family RNA methyltransferase
MVQAFKLAARGEGDHVLLDGWHLLHDAAAAGIELVAVALNGAPPSSRDAALIERLATRVDVYSVTAAVMAAMSPVRTPSGVAALARPRFCSLRDLLHPAPAFVVIASDVQDPGNVGAMIRSAEAGGASGAALVGASGNPWGWKALRAAMGSTFRLPIAEPGPHELLFDELRRRGVKLVATVSRGGGAMHHVDMRGPTAVIVGAEGRGLAAAVIARADEQVTIPMQKPVESLNVAVAAALLVYEARRQREREA